MVKTPPAREKKKQAKPRRRDWCPGGGVCIDWYWNHDKRRRVVPYQKNRTKFIRCGACGQRFEALFRECQDSGCVHIWVPKHKAY